MTIQLTRAAVLAARRAIEDGKPRTPGYVEDIMEAYVSIYDVDPPATSKDDKRAISEAAALADDLVYFGHAIKAAR